MLTARRGAIALTSLWVQNEGAENVGEAGSQKVVVPGNPIWGNFYAEDGEVYLWRAFLKGDHVNVASMSDMRLLASTIAGQQNWCFDLVGLAVQELGAGNEVTAVFTTPIVRNIHWPAVTAEDLAERATPALQSRWPGVKIASPYWAELRGSGRAIDFWSNEPVLWNANTGPNATTTCNLGLAYEQSGAPTAALAAGTGFYFGDPLNPGARGHNLTSASEKFKKQPGGKVYPPDPGGEPGKGGAKSTSPASSPLIYGVVGAVIGFGAVRVLAPKLKYRTKGWL